MKTKILLFLSAFFFLLSSAPLQAESDFKIAYVNMNKAINLSNEGKRSKKFLEAQAQQTKLQLQQDEQSLRKKESELKNMIMLSPKNKQAREKEIAQLRQSLRQKLTQAQKDFRSDEARHTGKIFKDIISVLNGIAREGDYDLVLENNVKQTILFSKYPMDDITERVITEYNKLQSLK
ncbi:MAG: hypothetical protein COB67_03750 [SAR324 cluster bacterium]|uniref:OmpH family outer membrane protein n=1 Tax=SAR324 cluster bacterium TaxID=2024889 RepID=A0A2A4T7H8_9DELT|nr:MAG: hypothetical protein COB67_03750 [SAR324 cluster bacterium]